MKFIKQHYFFVFLFPVSVVYVAQRLGIHLPEPVNNHLNDFLCIPIVLKIALYAARYIKSDNRLQIPFLLQLSITVLYAVYFEVVLPKMDNRYTSDPLDLVAYFLGLMMFVCLERRNRVDFWHIAKTTDPNN